MESAMPSGAPAAVRPGFRGVLCVSFGRTPVPAAEGSGRPRQDLQFERADQEALGHLQSVLSNVRVGVRLVLAGPSADIHAAAAAAAGCGLVDEEIATHPDTSGPHGVFCGHCHATLRTLQQPGSEVACHGCGTILVISSHFSRRHAGYLGYAAHAEEAA
ncbi:dimethylamine monooxygenase subunit DmmA family protein [Pseudarthrobacter sp. NPDC058329]|uniref:dimethylamine monooxygenase subunit DmmA family protein n=1 Tax=Pseudarthrobacter sp. NPDC058329 TaxID=3346448 RepID=UPI0036DC6646